MYTEEEQSIIDQAKSIVVSYQKRQPYTLTSSAATRDYLLLNSANLEHEMFSTVLLDNQHQLIENVELFRGTIDGAAVYPREVVKLVLQHNAAAVIFSHNHPSGIPTPSEADKRITAKLIDALNTIDVRVLDHVIVGSNQTFSFAEQGLL